MYSPYSLFIIRHRKTILANGGEYIETVFLECDGVNLELDDYIKNHSIDNNTLNSLREDIKNYNGNMSIVLDENCMDSVGRYKIFREDGNIYSTWEASEPDNR